MAKAVPVWGVALWIGAIILFLFSINSLRFHPPRIAPRSLDDPGTAVVASKHGSNFISQLPLSPKAVLFLAHGCGCKATFFWHKSPICPQCVGLPEETVYVHEALQKEYAVIAISSTGTCWSSEVDTNKVVSIMKDWIRKNHMEHLPLFALGASSGGYFVSTLALKLHFHAVVLVISEGHFEAMDFDEEYPPTLFVHMPRDSKRAVGVTRAMDILRNKGVETEEVQCKPVAVSEEYLHQRIPGLDMQLSQRVYGALQEAGAIDENGYMRMDGRAQVGVPWDKILPRDDNGKVKWLHHIREELNLAYAYHELTSLPAQDIFSWFERHMATHSKI